jgi:ribosomal protein L17
MASNTPTPWKSALTRVIADKLITLHKDGTTAIGADNLFQILRFPPVGPMGTNARWVARQIFNEVVDELPPVLRKRIL